MASRRQLLIEAIESTTAHGLSRTVGSQRHLCLRLFWLAAFLTVLGLFLEQLADAAVKLHSMPVSTAMDPTAEAFVFPDVHICSVGMVSASYPFQMGLTAGIYIDEQFIKIDRLLSLVNATGSAKMASLAFLSSVPRSFLSKYLGLRKEQTIISATLYPSGKTLELGVDITDESHHRNLNCFRVRVQNSTARALLNSVMGCIDLILYSDASYNQTVRLYGNAIDARGLTFSNYDPLIASGLRLIFTAENTYPDDYSTSVVLSPGFKHYIRLSMSHITRPAEKGQCVSGATDAQLIDEISGATVQYRHNLAACYANYFNVLMQRTFGCTLPGLFPIQLTHKNLSYCYNFSSYMEANISTPFDPELTRRLSFLKFLATDAQSEDLVAGMNYIQSQCQDQMPCSELEYYASSSASLFPVKQDSQANLAAYMNMVLLKRHRQGYSVPGLDWLTRQLMTANSSGDRSSVTEAVSDNIARALICSGQFRSASMAQSVSFDLNDFLAYCGGLMGLFMGISVLTMAELLDLLVCLLAGQRFKSESRDHGAESLPVDATCSAASAGHEFELESFDKRATTEAA